MIFKAILVLASLNLLDKNKLFVSQQRREQIEDNLYFKYKNRNMEFNIKDVTGWYK